MLALFFFCDVVEIFISNRSSLKLGMCKRETIWNSVKMQFEVHSVGVLNVWGCPFEDFWEMEVTFFIHVEKYSFISIGATVNK